MSRRPSPSFLVAVLALLVAASGAGYAVGTITSRDIKDNTIVSRDLKDGAVAGRDLRRSTVTGKQVRDGGLTGADLRNRSVPRAKLATGCAAGEAAVFGGCVRLAASGPTSHQAAVDDCSRRNGRLPTTLELTWIRSHDEYGWADGNPSQYEFSADYTASNPYTPIAFDRGGNAIDNASAQLFWHHCVTY